MIFFPIIYLKYFCFDYILILKIKQKYFKQVQLDSHLQAVVFPEWQPRRRTR